MPNKSRESQVKNVQTRREKNVQDGQKIEIIVMTPPPTHFEKIYFSFAWKVNRYLRWVQAMVACE